MNSLSKLEAIFFSALEIRPSQDRATFLDKECSGDADLRQRVEKMLVAQASASNFLESPPSAIDFDSALTIDRPLAEQPGTRIGPYKLLQQIGEGGFGIVYLAEQIEPVRRKVALKIIKPGMETKEVVARFESERQALALMDHPNIAKVFDAGTTGDSESLTPDSRLLAASSGRPYFVMELVKGIPITQFCDENDFSTEDRLQLLIQVCRAVQHAHQKGVIHRDLKPSNVMVTLHDSRPVPKVIDFGVAKATSQQLTERTLFTAYGQMIGTPVYMSPEQAQLNALDVDTRSDVYSLGVLLYELLTGTTPFDKDRLKSAGFDEMRRIIREEEPETVSTRLARTRNADLGTWKLAITPRSQLPSPRLNELDWIAMKSLEKDRAYRYETPSALAADLQRYLADEPVQACPRSKWYLLRKFAHRNKQSLATAAAVAITVLITAGVLGWAVRDRAARLEESAREEKARQTKLELEVGQALQETEDFYQRGNIAEAKSALNVPMACSPVGIGSAELGERMLRWQTDLSLVLRLEDISLDKATVKGQKFDFSSASAAYQQAFGEYGLNFDSGHIDDVVSRLRTSRIKPSVVAALDDWAGIERHLGTPNCAQLLGIARQADDDRWRNAFRDALLVQDRNVLVELAKGTELLDQPPATIVFLAAVLKQLNETAVAIDVLRRTQRRYPEDFWINHELAWYLTELPGVPPEEVVGFYRAALARRNDSAGVHSNLALALMRQGKLVEAEFHYRQALRLRPNLVKVHNNLGNILKRQGNLAAAEAEYREAIRLQPDYARGYSNLGSALHQQKRFAEAEASCRDAIRFQPTYALGHYNLALSVLAQHRSPEAAASFEKALRHESNHFGSITALAELLANGPDVELRNFPRARELAERAVAEQPQNTLAWDLLGTARYREGNWNAATEAMNKSMQLRSGSGRPRFILAMAHCQLGNHAEAKRFYDTACDLLPEALKNAPETRRNELHRLRSEAAALLGVE